VLRAFGFTELLASIPIPAALRLEKLVERGLEKIKTIGDAFNVAARLAAHAEPGTVVVAGSM
jgi:hypothetical protein